MLNDTSLYPSSGHSSAADASEADPPVGAAEAEVRARVDELESRLGDPRDPENPFGHAAVLAADERAELIAEAEVMLTEFGLNAEFVPRALGGRLDRVDTLGRVLRGVFRRDASLGLGYGATSLLASVSVWAGGTDEQKRRTAELLLGGGRLAVAFHELAHGNDLVRNEFSALPQDGGYLLNGRKEVINNVERAEALVLFARTNTAPGSRSHSVLLVDKAAVPADRIGYLPRFATAGMRGCLIGGVEFTDCPLPGDAVVGTEGGGVELALRSFQLTRSCVPSMVLGNADTALRTVVGFAVDRQLYGRSVREIPHARATLTGAFLDLLVGDCMALAATRAVHVLPEEAAVIASSTKYLVPKLLGEATYEMSVVLGANFYVRQGEYGAFQKHVRDLPVATLGHSGAAACQATVIPQLPRLARRSWFSGPQAPEALFGVHDDLPPLDTDRLALVSGGDSLAASLLAAAEAAETSTDAGEYTDALRTLVRGFTGELRALREECAALAPQDRTVLADPRVYGLADRYALLLAASACLGVWRGQRDEAATPFLSEPAWLVAALRRIAGRLGHALPPIPDGCSEAVWDELLARTFDDRSFDLYDTPLGGQG
ncbi:acyl-CoA dehydrogenase [Wenjunlia tyrosinilytica]|uniref:Acyl-CoA dehydrogenase n=1 Tax=Wenjunlia tyrosinilytica TaxID=1544741 RepID=A0A917ZRY0_9ACTN|nr:acyl-CoA dehydrogenase [Wenjunlia tyrosinilytica]GGO88908.1 acyl-CoA dehydrogenase [Wenjunlia tyrosinilytica]